MTKPVLHTVLYVSALQELDVDAILAAQPSAIVVDLEESVPADQKSAARERVPALCEDLKELVDIVAVRVNGAGDNANPDDCRMVGTLEAAVRVLLPKPVNQSSVGSLIELVGDRPVWLMGEERDAHAALPTLIDEHSAIEAVVIGSKDLLEELGETQLDLTSPVLLAAANRICDVVSAKNIPVIGGVIFGKPEGVTAMAKGAQSAGFQGVTLIRPKDAPAAASVFN